MKLIFLALAIPFLLFACKKSVTAPTDFNKFLQQSSTDSSEIDGSWILIATRHYSVPNNPDSSWKPQDTTQAKVVVDFSADSIFTYNNNYPRQALGYNRYSYLDTAFYASNPAFRVYATQPPSGNIGCLPTFARLLNPNVLVITYMGVDTGDEELYARTTP